MLDDPTRPYSPACQVVNPLRVKTRIPLFFAAVKNPKGCYVDGGLFENYPIKLFDRMRYIECRKT